MPISRHQIAARASHVWTVFRYRQKAWRMQRAQVSRNVSVSPSRARAYWREHFGIGISTRWHKVFAQAYGRDDERFVPEDVFYTRIEPILNTLELFRAHSDKNLYERWLPGSVLPQAVLRCIHRRFHTPDLVETDPGQMLDEGERYFIKPSLQSGGGRQVSILTFRNHTPELDGRPTSWPELITLYGGNFIVQRPLEQHPDIAAIHPSSINTLRIMTLRMKESHVLSTVLRVGRHGSLVDNQTAGGISCGVDAKGRFNPWAVDAVGNRSTEHPDTGYLFGGQPVPGIFDAWEMVRALHKQLFYFDIASWDVSIGPKSQPTLVEVNVSRQEVNFHQLNNGPLFGELTEEVLGWVRTLTPEA